MAKEQKSKRFPTPEYANYFVNERRKKGVDIKTLSLLWDANVGAYLLVYEEDDVLTEEEIKEGEKYESN